MLINSNHVFKHLITAAWVVQYVRMRLILREIFCFLIAAMEGSTINGCLHKSCVIYKFLYISDVWTLCLYYWEAAWSPGCISKSTSVTTGLSVVNISNVVATVGCCQLREIDTFCNLVNSCILCASWLWPCISNHNCFKRIKHNYFVFEENVCILTYFILWATFSHVNVLLFLFVWKMCAF